MISGIEEGKLSIKCKGNLYYESGYKTRLRRTARETSALA
jgi:hypothetical protein